MKKYFEIPQVRTEALNPANSIMDEPLASKNLAYGNAVNYEAVFKDNSATGDYNIWKGFGK